MRPHNGLLTVFSAVLSLLGAWPASAQRSERHDRKLRLSSWISRKTFMNMATDPFAASATLARNSADTRESLFKVGCVLIGDFLDDRTLHQPDVILSVSET